MNVLLSSGFKLIRKHKDEILILVKMMYSSHGDNLPCFKGGTKLLNHYILCEIKKAIELFKNLKRDFLLQESLKIIIMIIVKRNQRLSYYNICLLIIRLINQSLDNWRAKCYDKYQYLVQGIFY